MAAGCDRLVHPSVADAPQRGRHRRLIAVLLTIPFLAACAFGQTLFDGFGAATALAAVFAVSGLFWFAALVVASTGRDRPAGEFVLAVSVLPAAAIMAGAGGLTSPFALIATAFVFEAAWVWRTRTAALWGLAAGSAALLLQGWLGPLSSAGAGAGSASHWLVPLAYAATLGLRVAELLRAKTAEATDPAATRLEDVIDAVVFRFESNGDVAGASGKARAILCLPPELLLGNGLFERIHVADRVAYLCALADLREGAPWRRLELRLRLPGETAERTGKYLPFTIEIAPMVQDGAAFVGIVRSNAELAALRLALASAAESANSLEIAKGRFLAAVSHELRTPLNAVIGFSDMLDHGMCGDFSDPRQKEYVALIKDSGQHLLAVVNSILDVSKIESGTYPIHVEAFRFGDAVAMCHSMLSFQAAAKAITFNTRLGQNIGEIVGDRRAIQQMLINLASNAIKFTPDGGEVTIGAKRIGSRLHFWVSDNGIGIGADDLARLGTPFTQVQNDYTRQFEGTGLGLSLVKGLVALHDGTMSMESAPGEGTTVTISLPIAGPAKKKGGGVGEEIAVRTTPNHEGTDVSLRKTG